MKTHKCSCVECGKKVNTNHFADYEIDDYGDLRCISCAEHKSDTGEAYSNAHSEENMT